MASGAQVQCTVRSVSACIAAQGRRNRNRTRSWGHRSFLMGEPSTRNWAWLPTSNRFQSHPLQSHRVRRNRAYSRRPRRTRSHTTSAPIRGLLHGAMQQRDDLDSRRLRPLIRRPTSCSDREQQRCCYCQSASSHEPSSQFRTAGPATQVALILSTGVLTKVPVALTRVQVWLVGCVVIVTT